MEGDEVQADILLLDKICGIKVEPGELYFNILVD